MPPRCRGSICGHTNPKRDRARGIKADKVTAFTENELWQLAVLIHRLFAKLRTKMGVRGGGVAYGLMLSGTLTVYLKAAKARNQLRRLDFMFYKVAESKDYKTGKGNACNIGAELEKLILAGTLDWQIMQTMRSRFPEINWPKRPIKPPQNWKDVSRDKLIAPQAWPQKWRNASAMGEKRVKQQIFAMQMYGEFVYLNFDALFGKEITPSMERLLLTPDGDLELFFRVGSDLWNKWIRINRWANAPTSFVPGMLPSERRTRADLAKRTIPQIEEYRRTFERATKGKWSRLMSEMIRVRLEELNRRIRHGK